MPGDAISGYDGPVTIEDVLKVVQDVVEPVLDD
jgi:hypothetical protein